jgi:phospholipid/cholesterol/gamma-HCH transport system substrate-binding protein
MDTQSANFKARLGLFVIIGIALFILAIFIVGKQRNLFNPVFRLSTTFQNVSGLQVGNNIRFSGINVGTVDNITIINDSAVLVEMIIRQEVKRFIKEDCVVTLGSEGIIGDRVLVISQGSFDAALVTDGQELPSIEPVETDAIMASLMVTAENAEIITNELAEIFVKINSGKGALGRLIQDTVIAENINQTIVNLKKSSKGLDENMEAAKENILLRGYFKRKAKAAEKKKRKQEEKNEKKAK